MGNCLWALIVAAPTHIRDTQHPCCGRVCDSESVANDNSIA